MSNKKITFKERKKIKDILGNILLDIDIKDEKEDFSNFTEIELDDHIKQLQSKINLAKKIKKKISIQDNNIENLTNNLSNLNISYQINNNLIENNIEKINYNFNEKIEKINIDFEEYCKKDLISYLGNKRELLLNIQNQIEEIQHILGKNKLICMDGFSGSGCVSKMLKYFSSELHTNDLEDYCYTLNSCYLDNPTKEKIEQINKNIDFLNNISLDYIGNISKYYSPKDDNNITENERCLYTHENGLIIDNIRQNINFLPEEFKKYCLAPLIVKSSIHCNTLGQFKGILKGFGGEKNQALSRIKTKIYLNYPTFLINDCKIFIHQKNTNNLIKQDNLPLFDIVYYDPPYNQHPYSSNYYMLNLINNQTELKENPKGISGIIKGWNKSDYNYKSTVKKLFIDLLKNTKSLFIIISYNNEGYITNDDWINILSEYKYKKIEIDYSTYKGSRNLKNRSKKVKEILWIIDKREFYIINIKNNFLSLPINENIEIDYNKLTFIELFCGLGVFHISINNIIKENECLLSCDINDDVKNVYNLNFNRFPEHDVYNIDLSKYEKIDMIVGSPPCQSFSIAGKKLGIEDIRGELFFYTLDLIGKYQPKYSILENVRNILKVSNGFVLKTIIKKCEEIGYYMKYFLTNPKIINIPQNRDRVYFILIRKDLTNVLILEKLEQNYNMLIEKYKQKNINCITNILDNHIMNDLPDSIIIPINVFNELILQLPNEKTNINLNYIWYIKNIKENKFDENKHQKMLNLYNKHKNIFDNFYIKNKEILDELPKTKKILEWTCGDTFNDIWKYNIQYRPSGIRVKHPNKYPCLTKTGLQLIIGKEKRFITVKECSRLQSFPNNYIFLDDDKISYEQLGNSINVEITSLIVETLYLSIDNQINKNNIDENKIRQNKIKNLLNNNNLKDSINKLIVVLKRWKDYF